MIRIVMFILHLYYKKHGEPIFYVKGTDDDFPKYLLYTEDPYVYERMEQF
jgi:hypothetical protein